MADLCNFFSRGVIFVGFWPIDYTARGEKVEILAQNYFPGLVLFKFKVQPVIIFLTVFESFPDHSP